MAAFFLLPVNMINASQGETHYGRGLGAHAPAALTCDNRRAFRETRPFPHSSKNRLQPVFGVCPPFTTTSTGGLWLSRPAPTASRRAARLVLALTDKERRCKIRTQRGIPRIVPLYHRLPYCRVLLPRLAVCSCWRGWMLRSTVSPMFRAVCRMRSRDLPRSSGV